MSSQLFVRVSLSPSVALSLGLSRAGRSLVPVSEEGVQALDADERATLARYATTEADPALAWRHSQRELDLTAAPSWEAVAAALRPATAEDAAKRATDAQERAERFARLTAYSPEDAVSEQGSLVDAVEAVIARMTRSPGGGGYAGSTYFLAEPPQDAPSELLAWIERVRALRTERHAVWEAGAPERAIQAVLAIPPAACFDGESVSGARWMSQINAVGLSPWRLDGATHPDPRVQTWLDAVQAEPARVAQKRSVRAEVERVRWAPLLAWASARDEAIRCGTAEGYDQRAMARALVYEVLGDALALPDCALPEIGDSDPALPVRTSVAASSLARLAALRTAAESLALGLPEGVTLEVGRLSRQQYVEHSEECLHNDGDECDESGCEPRKRTVVPVRVTGLPDACWVIVPVE